MDQEKSPINQIKPFGQQPLTEAEQKKVVAALKTEAGSALVHPGRKRVPKSPEEITEVDKIYQDVRQMVLDKFGEPVYAKGPFGGPVPGNASAQKLMELKGVYMVCKRKGVVMDRLTSLAKQIKEEGNNPVAADTSIPLEFLVPYSETEKRIIVEYFNRISPPLQLLAKVTGTTIEEVSRLLNSVNFKKTEQMVCEAFKMRLPYEAWVAIRSCLASKDANTTKLNAALAVLEDVGQIRTRADTEMNVYNVTKIVDPKAEKALRELGDSLANEVEQPSVAH